MIRTTYTRSTTCGAPPASATMKPKSKSACRTRRSTRWDLIFKPEIAGEVQGLRCHACSMRRTTFLPAVLNYLGLDPNSTNPDDIKKAGELLEKVRPTSRSSIRPNTSMRSPTATSALRSATRATSCRHATAPKKPRTARRSNIRCPKQGAQMWFDLMAIPADAKNVEEAHTFLNYMMQAGSHCQGFELSSPTPTAIWPRRNSSTTV